MKNQNESDSINGANLAANLVNLEVNMRQLGLMRRQLAHDEMNLLIVALLVEIRDILKGGEDASN